MLLGSSRLTVCPSPPAPCVSVNNSPSLHWRQSQTRRVSQDRVASRHLLHWFRNSEVSSRTGLAPVSDRISRGRNAIFGHAARLPDNIPAHQAMLYAKSSYRSVDLQTLHGNVHQVDHVPNGPTNFAAITMFPLRLCGGKLLVAVTRERRYGPSRLRVNDDDDDVSCDVEQDRTLETETRMLSRDQSLLAPCE